MRETEIIQELTTMVLRMPSGMSFGNGMLEKSTYVKQENGQHKPKL